VLGYLAVYDGTADRSQLAGSLWPDLPESRASANLRMCLWRLRRTAPPLVDISAHQLRLSDAVEVDFQRLVSVAQTILEGAIGDGWSAWRELVNAHDVLEGWSEEWLVVPREHFRQLRLQALEGLAVSFAESSRLGQALECAQAALAMDPLRESAQSVAIRIHVQQGNRTEALRQFRGYCQAMRSELGLPPARNLYDLVSEFGLPVDASSEMGPSGDSTRGAAPEGREDTVRDTSRWYHARTKDGPSGVA
jgi:DNA-binding SARP family transcriptional activator